jgi:hypothetical protein
MWSCAIDGGSLSDSHLAHNSLNLRRVSSWHVFRFLETKNPAILWWSRSRTGKMDPLFLEALNPFFSGRASKPKKWTHFFWKRSGENAGFCCQVPANPAFTRLGVKGLISQC